MLDEGINKCIHLLSMNKIIDVILGYLDDCYDNNLPTKVIVSASDNYYIDHWSFRTKNIVSFCHTHKK